jgi:hypothetical protein
MRSPSSSNLFFFQSVMEAFPQLYNNQVPFLDYAGLRAFRATHGLHLREMWHCPGNSLRNGQRVAAVNGFNQFSTILKVERELIDRSVNQDDSSIDLDSQGLPWVVTEKRSKAGHCNSSIPS